MQAEKKALDALRAASNGMRAAPHFSRSSHARKRMLRSIFGRRAQSTAVMGKGPLATTKLRLSRYPAMNLGPAFLDNGLNSGRSPQNLHEQYCDGDGKWPEDKAGGAKEDQTADH